MRSHPTVSPAISAALIGTLSWASLAPAHAQPVAPAAAAPGATPQSAAPEGNVAPAAAAYPPAPNAYPPAAYPSRYPQQPAPPYAVAPNGQYVAPLSQTMQPTYVPQSVALSGPRMIKDWREGEPIPYGYHREERVRKGMVIGGAITFGVPYLYSSLIASIGSDTSSSNKTDALWIPVLGPFIEMGQTDSTAARYVLTLDGLAQTIGAAMFIYGLAVPRPLLVRNDLASMTITPVHLGKDGTGLGVVGIF